MITRPAVRTTANAACWGLASASVVCFLLVSFMRPTDWYNSDVEFSYIRGNMTLNLNSVDIPTQVVIKDGKNVTQLIGKVTPLWNGSIAFPVTLQWGSVLVATLAAAGIMYLRLSSPNSIVDKDSLMATAPNAETFWGTFKRTVHYVAAYQLPPRRIWGWWCGGLNVLDAFLVLTWCAFAIVYLYYNMQRKVRSTDALFAPGKKVPEGDPTFIYIQKRLEGGGKSVGEAMRGTIMLMFFPVSRSSFLQWLTGNDFSTLIRYHRWLSWGTMILMYFHGFLYMTLWGSAGDFEKELSWQTEKSRRNIMGLISCISATLIVLTSSSWMRANYFKLFYRTHIIGFIGFTLFSLMHYKNLINWIAPGLVFYGLDRAFRAWQLATNWSSLGPNNTNIDGNILTMKLDFAKGSLGMRPGQTIYLRVPSISLPESHPFSVADVVQHDTGVSVTVHVRTGGKWTLALQKRIENGETVSIQLQGPYESKLSFIEANQNQCIVMIAGGIGITPLLGLLRALMHRWSSGDMSGMPQVHLLWSSRSLCELRLLGADLLAALKLGGGCASSPKQQTKLLDNANSFNAGKASFSISGDLFYTGFEQEREQHGIDITPVKGGRDASASGPTMVKPLQAHPMSHPWVYALCAVVCFFGAWAGLLAASYYDAYYLRTTALGSNYLAVGVLQWICVALGATLPVLAILAVLKVFSQYRNSRKTVCPPRDTSMRDTSLMALPGYILAPVANPSEGVQLQRGRPDVVKFLRRVKEQHPDVEQIDVLVAGPDAMYLVVQQACAETGSLDHTLVCHRVAHLH